MAEGKKPLCELVEFVVEVGIADEDDTTTGANLNRLIKGVQKLFPGIEIPVKTLYDGTSVVDATGTDTTTGADLNSLIEGAKIVLGDIDVADATETDTTTGANLNSLIAAVEGVLGDIDVEDAKAEDWDTTTGANLNSLLAAIIKGVATTICA